VKRTAVCLALLASPGISVASGPFYWALAAEPQLGRRTSLAAVQIRSIFGIVL
jgi:hypothetical protein